MAASSTEMVRIKADGAEATITGRADGGYWVTRGDGSDSWLLPSQIAWPFQERKPGLKGRRRAPRCGECGRFMDDTHVCCTCGPRCPECGAESGVIDDGWGGHARDCADCYRQEAANHAADARAERASAALS